MHDVAILEAIAPYPRKNTAIIASIKCLSCAHLPQSRDIRRRQFRRTIGAMCIKIHPAPDYEAAALVDPIDLYVYLTHRQCYDARV